MPTNKYLALKTVLNDQTNQKELAGWKLNLHKIIQMENLLSP